MISVKLSGYLREKYGTGYKLAINSVAECIRALSANFKDFRKDFQEGKFYIFVDDVNVGLNECLNLIGGKEIRIIPLVHGAGGKFFKILIGAALIAVGTLTFGTGTFLGTFLVATGTSLVLSGITELLFAPEKPDDEQEQSTAFGGPANVTRQGAAVPLAYGRIMTGSSVISAGISS